MTARIPMTTREIKVILEKYPILSNADLIEHLVDLGYPRRTVGTLAGYAARHGVNKKGRYKSGHKPVEFDVAPVAEPEVVKPQALLAPQGGISTLALTRAMTNADHSVYSLAAELEKDPKARNVCPDNIRYMATCSGVPAKNARDFIRHLRMKGVKG